MKMQNNDFPWDMNFKDYHTNIEPEQLNKSREKVNEERRLYGSGKPYRIVVIGDIRVDKNT
ncbi:hypothetical protein [Macellibacteroides fermentans]|uniref:hypothetical protein n=1 Tax=Macellibacteroides fermentans TaxID=879969 RepID=UPI00406CEB06